MFLTKLFMCLLALYSCDALKNSLGTCEDCIFIRSCPAAVMRAASKIDESTRNFFKNAYCGIGTINHKLTPKICCSDFVDLRGRNNDNVDIDDEIEKHEKIALLPEACGNVNGDRIIGGLVANLYEFPWMTLISYRAKTRDGKRKLQFRCGGTIINSKYILTAAHCVENQTIAGVRVGEFDVASRIDCQGEYPHVNCINKLQDIRVEKTIPHSDYLKYPNIQNDIALIRLRKPVDFSFKNAAPICLPVHKSLRNLTLSGKIGTIAGWGLTESDRESKVLLKVDLPILHDTICSQFYARKSEPNEDNSMDKKFCAGEIGKDSCKGDSGGPLMLQEEYNDMYRMYQYGIVSYGPSRCGSHTPGVYTDVTKYIKWILDNIEE